MDKKMMNCLGQEFAAVGLKGKGGKYVVQCQRLVDAGYGVEDAAKCVAEIAKSAYK